MNNHSQLVGLAPGQAAPANGPPVCAAYLRVSTSQQTGSIQVQDQICLEYARLKGFILPADLIFQDEDISGSKPMAERRGGAGLLRTLRSRSGADAGPAESAPRIQHVIVAKLDRLGRNVEDILRTTKLLDALGVCIHFVDLGGEILTTQGPIGKVLLTVMAAFAEYERDRIAERIRDRFRAKRLAGEATSKRPYGWDLVPSGRVNPKTGRPTMLVKANLEEQNWIRQMAAWRSAGLSYNRIARLLNQQAVPTAVPADTTIKCRGGATRLSSGQWGTGSVAHVLKSTYTKHLLNHALPAS